jgi:predicted PurR-regulated permease PerM
VTEPVQSPTSVLDSRALRILWTTLAFVSGLAIAVVARKTLIILVFALLFAYLMEPIIARVQHWMKGKRVRAVAISYLAFWLVVTGLFVLGGKTVIEQGRNFAAKAPETAQKVESGEFAKEFGQKHGLSEQTSSRMQQWIQKHQGDIQKMLAYFKDKARRAASGLLGLFLVPLLAMLFPQDKARFPLQMVDTYASGRNRAFLSSVIQDCDRMLGEYMWAQFLLSLFAMIAFGVALTLLKVPYALLFAVAAFFLEFIFVVGPAIAALLVMGTALVSGGNWIGALIFLAVWRVIQDYVNTPLLFKHELEMHPLVVIGAVLIGGEVFGGLGMFLAVPIAAGIRIMWWRYLQMQEQATDQQRLLDAKPSKAA